jgi:hypothetical protein
VRPQSSHRRYTTGCDSDRPITRAPGIPQRGHTTTPVEVRFAMNLLLAIAKTRTEALRSPLQLIFLGVCLSFWLLNKGFETDRSRRKRLLKSSGSGASKSMRSPETGCTMVNWCA